MSGDNQPCFDFSMKIILKLVGPKAKLTSGDRYGIEFEQVVSHLLRKSHHFVRDKIALRALQLVQVNTGTCVRTARPNKYNFCLKYSKLLVAQFPFFKFLYFRLVPSGR